MVKIWDLPSEYVRTSATDDALAREKIVVRSETLYSTYMDLRYSQLPHCLKKIQEKNLENYIRFFEKMFSKGAYLLPVRSPQISLHFFVHFGFSNACIL